VHKSRLFIGVLDDDDTNQQGMIDRLFSDNDGAQVEVVRRCSGW
jgi:hypothetical protein